MAQIILTQTPSTNDPLQEYAFLGRISTIFSVQDSQMVGKFPPKNKFSKKQASTMLHLAD